MKLEHHCQAAEARLRGVEASLLEFRSDAVDLCREELPKVIEALQCWTAAPQPVDAQDRSALKSLREALGRIRALADHGSNLCLGWMQLGLSEGYTNQGRPSLLETGGNALYEG